MITDILTIIAIFIIVLLTLLKRNAVENFQPAQSEDVLPYITSSDGDGPTVLNDRQRLAASPLFEFRFIPGDTTTDIEVRDTQNDKRVWGVTIVGQASSVSVGDGTFFVKDKAGAILWSSPSPSGPNAGSPFILTVTNLGNLEMRDKTGRIVFSTPNPQAAVPISSPAVQPVQEAIVAAPSVRLGYTTPAHLDGNIVLGPDYLLPTGPYGAPRFFYPAH